MLKEKWNLDVLYTSIESKEYKDDKLSLERTINELNVFMQKEIANLSNAEGLKEFIKRVTDIEKYRKTMTYVHLYLSTHSTDEIHLKESENLVKLNNNSTIYLTLFKKYVAHIENLDEIIEKEEFLKEYSLFIKETKEQSEYALSEAEEILLAKLKQSGSFAYTKLRDSYISSLLVDVNVKGETKKVNFPALRNMAFSPNLEERKEGYTKEIEHLGKIEKTIAAALNGIKGEVITEAETRGYSSPLDYTLKSQRMDQKTLDTMLKAMTNFLPEYERYFLKKAELLGHKNGLPFYDLFAPIGSNLTYTYDEASQYIVKSFGEFSEELGAFADHAFKNQWIDAIPYENKREGAFCSNVNQIKESRILSNFGGDYSGLTTLAHELGHGFHGHCLKNEPPINCRYPMPLAETASIFCETIIKNNALKTATKEEKLFILENSLQDSSQVIVDILSRFLFEDKVFKGRVNGSLTPNELNNFMLEAQKETYGKGLDSEHLHKYMWIVKGHYYSAGRNYYNFPYAFGILFATGIYAIYEKEPEGFIEKYKKLLRDTGKMSIYEVGKSIGLDLHDINFYNNSLAVIKREIDEFVSL
ncbi:MAG: M3 family oligoendopeptidase [Lachnospirales bacterium]